VQEALRRRAGVWQQQRAIETQHPQQATAGECGAHRGRKELAARKGVIECTDLQILQRAA
jgi:hypothetical protein